MIFFEKNAIIDFIEKKLTRPLISFVQKTQQGTNDKSFQW